MHSYENYDSREDGPYPIPGSERLWKLIAVSLLFSFFTACSNDNTAEREAEHYLLPAEYVGAFYTVFSQAQGKPVDHEQGARQYEIPDDGILLVRGTPNEGVVRSEDIRFFLKSEAGALQEVSARWTTSITDHKAAREDPTVYIFGGGPGVFSSSAHTCDIRFRGFHIGTKAQILDGVGHFDIEDFLKERPELCPDASRQAVQSERR